MTIAIIKRALRNSSTGFLLRNLASVSTKLKDRVAITFLTRTQSDNPEALRPRNPEPSILNPKP